MAKKISFDKLPEAVEKILQILTSEESEHTLLPELLQRMIRLEKKVEYLQLLAAPDKPTMEMHEVCRTLKLRPKAVNELAIAGVLPSREQGRKTVFYEDGVMKYFATLPAWKGTKEKPERVRKHAVSNENIPEEIPADGRQRVGIDVAVRILDRKPGAVYQLLKTSSVPHYREGRQVYFFTDELREWVLSHPPRKRKAKNQEQ